MLSKRVIVCLDVREGKTTKGVKFQDNVDVGDPVEMAARYYEDGVDELVFYDITASHEKRGIMIDVVRRVAQAISIPFSVGGGLRTVEDMRDPLPPEVEDAFRDISKSSNFYGGHGGSHAYLVHEFVEAVAEERRRHLEGLGK